MKSFFALLVLAVAAASAQDTPATALNAQALKALGIGTETLKLLSQNLPENIVSSDPRVAPAISLGLELLEGINARANGPYVPAAPAAPAVPAAPVYY